MVTQTLSRLPITYGGAKDHCVVLDTKYNFNYQRLRCIGLAQSNLASVKYMALQPLPNVSCFDSRVKILTP